MYYYMQYVVVGITGTREGPLLCTTLYYSVLLCTTLYYSVLLCTTLHYSILGRLTTRFALIVSVVSARERTSAPDNEQCDGQWRPGFLEMGESAEEGAVREAREELNADVQLGDLLAVYSLPHINIM